MPCTPMTVRSSCFFRRILSHTRTLHSDRNIFLLLLHVFYSFKPVNILSSIFVNDTVNRLWVRKYSLWRDITPSPSYNNYLYSFG